MELTDLRKDARYLVSPQLTSTEYPDVDLDRNINRWYRTVLGWVIPILGDWEISGDIIYHDFEKNITDIDLPLQIMRIVKGEVMYATGGKFVPLNFIEPSRNQELVEGNSTRTIDNPEHPTAELRGDTLTIKPAPTETVVNGVKLWVQLDLVSLSQASDVPDFMEAVQRVISIGAAADYALAEEMVKKEDQLNKRIYGDPSKPNDTGLKGMIEELYSVRSGARRDRLTAKKFNYK